ncbi:LytR/AlgR family response regulator transcription factor [Flavilitoribacter nigricans]|uniref:DNA-binding response regulator n=1 Tax=Flavilitoribacter nigricans (strain ATCC 23147 / DSM 23189 / NBRC 102662 / NCIMB 1420 / SS-2) TaxID=1122177 RepID=A0A2D0N2W7_FLAN2|nr:LytTR family DNA-binding domain-containing protein [Flavilitoribacter nigricans]PHN02845.1 DNA-binding response regulator [Flavilitoribacter nigricans DSM 23189 = NBRC 102662]
MITAVIIEDEINGLNNLKNLLNEHCDDVDIIGEAGSVAQGVSLFSDPNIKPDVAFLDISLPDGLIFQLLNQIRPIDFDIIFVTAYQEYAIKACEYSSIGYIVKPIDPDMLREAVSRIKPRQSNQTDGRLDIFNNYYNNPNAFTKMSISALDGIYFVNIKDIVRFEAEDNYTHIYLNSGERITASKTIKAYEDMLLPFNFYRVHKRHVINLNYMRKFVKGDGGYLVMDDDIKIEVSRRRRPAFMEQMRRLQEGL